MRDMKKEGIWTEHPIIGYISLDENGAPYQPILDTGRRSKKKPITVYKTMKMAV